MIVQDATRSQLNWYTEAPMYKTPRQSYTTEFKQEAIRQIKADGKPQEQVVRGLGISKQALANWCKAYKAGKLTGSTRKAHHPRANGTLPPTR